MPPIRPVVDNVLDARPLGSMAKENATHLQGKST